MLLLRIKSRSAAFQLSLCVLLVDIESMMTDKCIVQLNAPKAGVDQTLSLLSDSPSLMHFKYVCNRHCGHKPIDYEPTRNDELIHRESR